MKKLTKDINSDNNIYPRVNKNTTTNVVTIFVSNGGGGEVTPANAFCGKDGVYFRGKDSEFLCGK